MSEITEELVFGLLKQLETIVETASFAEIRERLAIIGEISDCDLPGMTFLQFNKVVSKLADRHGVELGSSISGLTVYEVLDKIERRPSDGQSVRPMKQDKNLLKDISGGLMRDQFAECG